MTLAETTIDYFAAHLFRDYLALSHADWMALLDRTPTEDSEALDLADTLPRHSMDLGKDPVFPSLLVAAREASGNTKARRKVEVSCILMTWLKATVAAGENEPATATQQLNRAESAALQIAVETRLQDTEAFYAFLASLDADRLAGWSILPPMIIANASPDRDKTQHTINFATTVTLTFVVARRVA